MADTVHVESNFKDHSSGLFTWSIRNFSLVKELYKQAFSVNGYEYWASMRAFSNEFILTVWSFSKMKWEVSLKNSLGELILPKSLYSVTDADQKLSGPFYKYCSHVVHLSSKDKDFEKLKHLPNDELIIVCRVSHGGEITTKPLDVCFSSAPSFSDYLKTLACDLKDLPDTSAKEKVCLIVGTETETVNKAVLCSRSPVFARMFQNEMREQTESAITIADIRMPVLRSVISFLYTGSIFDNDFNFLCELYYAADKYDFSELRDACCDLLLPQITVNNVFRLLKLSSSHSDSRLKTLIMSFISMNIKPLILTDEWKNLMRDDPKMALEAFSFFHG